MTTRTDGNVPADSLEVRGRLVEALKLDLVGPWAGHALADEQLPGWVRPSNWYLTGFLIPSGTPLEKSADADEDDDMGGEIPESAGLAEESNEERKAAKKGFFPSSMGLSFLVPKEVGALTVTVRWGAYAQAEVDGADGKPVSVWQRAPREATVPVPLIGGGDPVRPDVPDSGGLQLHVVERPLVAEELERQIPRGTRSVSVFLVNHRTPIKPEEGEPDLAYAFQPEIEVLSDRPFVPRPDLRGAQAAEWDEQIADLHYADTPEYATGHGVSAEWEIANGACHLLCTAWITSAEVEKTVTVDVPGVELSMEGSRHSPMAPRLRRRFGRLWPSTEDGSKRNERPLQGFKSRAERPLRSSYGSPASPPIGSIWESLRLLRTPTRSTPSVSQTAWSRALCASDSRANSRRLPRAGAPSSLRSSC